MPIGGPSTTRTLLRTPNGKTTGLALRGLEGGGPSPFCGGVAGLVAEGHQRVEDVDIARMTARSTFEDAPSLGRPAGVVQGDAIDKRVPPVTGVSLGRHSQPHHRVVVPLRSHQLQAERVM